MAITYEDIASTFYQRFATLNDNLDTDTTLVYPFKRLDTKSANDWIEVWLREWRERRRATGQKSVWQGRVELRLFARPGSNVYRINLLQKASDDAFLHAELTIGSTGGIRVFEPQTRNVTRSFNEVRSDTRAVMKTYEAIAQEH